MKKYTLYASVAFCGVLGLGGCSTAPQASTAQASSPKVSLYESPSAKEIVQKDRLLPPQKHEMPDGCVSNDSQAIALGKILFNDYNNKKHKFKEFPDGKEFGNCVACHNIEGAKGYGNIGPDLSGYKTNFVDAGVRTHAWIYQKIADARIDDAATKMTINKTNGLLNEQEICQVMSYVLAKK